VGVAQLGLRKGLKPLANTPFSITVVADRPADPSEPTRVRAGEDVLVEVRSTAFGGWGDANVAPAWVQVSSSYAAWGRSDGKTVGPHRRFRLTHCRSESAFQSTNLSRV
jgi:hypothetical protein